MTVEVDFSGADRFKAKVAAAVSDGTLAAAAALSDEVTRGYGSTGGGPYERRVSKKTGLPYWKGPGAPKGGYPGKRSHLLSQSTGAEREGVDALSVASTAYARHVHRTHPFFLLGLKTARALMQRRFTDTVRRRLGGGP